MLSILSLVFSFLAAQGLALDGPILITPGNRGQPSIYRCPEPSTLCYSATGEAITWGSINHKCIVEYPNGKGYCTVRLSEDCYAFEYEQQYYPQCEIE